jgi:hypothetical protein
VLYYTAQGQGRAAHAPVCGQLAVCRHCKDEGQQPIVGRGASAMSCKAE